jgi:uncharacterized protein (DUF952 family)
MTGPLYKVLRVVEWQAAEQAGRFAGSPDDRRDGFIHLSTAEQVRATVAKHFVSEDYLVLAAVDPDALGERLRWEVSRGGTLFPHLYGELPLTAVIGLASVQRDAENEPIFPEEIP